MERLRGNFTWPLALLLSSLECANWSARGCESRSKGGPVFLWMDGGGDGAGDGGDGARGLEEWRDDKT